MDSVRKAEQASIIEDSTISEARTYITSHRSELGSLNPPYLLFTLDIQELLRDEKYDEAAKKLVEAITGGTVKDGTNNATINDNEKKNLSLMLVKVLSIKAQAKDGDISKAIEVADKAIKDGSIEFGGKTIDLKQVDKEIKSYREDLFIKLLQNGAAGKYGAATKALEYMKKNEASLKKTFGDDKYEEMRLKLTIDQEEGINGIESAYKKAQELKTQLVKVMGDIPVAQYLEEMKVRMVIARKLTLPGYGTGPDAALKYLKASKSDLIDPK
ncbi:MAG TPA: hypothetical protein VMD02_02385, partial [Candidatus Omnitrophota bacterium]|nr:hypothetical protein [Candidatus Omnitrophota bacterium]